MKSADITVIMTVYNKKEFLERAIHSVLSQKTQYHIGLLLMDDGSSDGSDEIERAYADDYPDLITLVQNEVNRGLCYTVFRAYEMLETRYYAVLDADDYWIGDRHLDKAIGFLEEHPDYSCYGCNYFYESLTGQRMIAVDQWQDGATAAYGDELIPLQTSATVYRNHFTREMVASLRDRIGEERRHPFQADTFRNLFSIHFGKMYFENSVDAVWTQGIGMWGSMTDAEKYMLNVRTYYELADWLFRSLGDERNASYCLYLARMFYDQAVDELARMMHDFSILQWKSSPYFTEYLHLYGDDAVSLPASLLEYGIKLKEIGADRIPTLTKEDQ